MRDPTRRRLLCALGAAGLAAAAGCGGGGGGDGGGTATTTGGSGGTTDGGGGNGKGGNGNGNGGGNGDTTTAPTTAPTTTEDPGTTTTTTTTATTSTTRTPRENYPVPDVAFETVYAPDEGVLLVAHAGGDEFTDFNTDSLVFEVDGERVATWEVPVRPGDETTVEASSGSTVTIVWTSPNGKTETVGEFQVGGS